MRIPVLALLVLLSGCAATRPGCVPRGSWVNPATLGKTADPLASAVLPDVILLGEQHDSAADHAWQLDSLRRLRARGVRLVLGFEQFRRSEQPVLDAWVRGDLSEAEFLRQSNWKEEWGFPAELYLPIFRFARDNRIPMRALNVSRALIRLTATRGWAGVPVSGREGVGTPAPPSAGYKAMLSDAMAHHGGPEMSQERLQRFIDAQLVWDRAMAEGIASAHAASPGATVVALMGVGHVENRDGVPHQLAALGIPDALVLIPAQKLCAPETAGYADAIYAD
jgi:uncharacterized iron-regulated protein